MGRTKNREKQAVEEPESEDFQPLRRNSRRRPQRTERLNIGETRSTTELDPEEAELSRKSMRATDLLQEFGMEPDQPSGSRPQHSPTPSWEHHQRVETWIDIASRAQFQQDRKQYTSIPSKPTKAPTHTHPARPHTWEATPKNPYGIRWAHISFAERYAQFILQERTIMPSRFIDEDTLHSLGIFNQVHGMVNSLNMWGFLTQVEPTYRSLTVEFWCTVVFQSSDATISFFLQNRFYLLHVNEFAQIMGWPAGDMYHHPFTPIEYGDFLAQITGRYYNPKNKKVSLIQHPVIRYVQRVLAWTIFGRGESASLFNHVEIWYLFAMLYQNISDNHYDPNGAISFIQCLNNTLYNQWRGPITIGGIVTRLFKHFRPDYSLNDNDIVRGKRTVDLEVLMSAGILRRQSRPYRPPFILVGHAGQETSLPRDDDFDLTNPATWIIYRADDAPPHDHIHPEGAEGHPQPHNESQPPPPQFQGASYPPQPDWGAFGTQLLSQMTQLTTRFEEMQVAMNTGFQDMNAGFRTINRIDQRLDDFGRRLDSFDQRFQIVETHTSRLYAGAQARGWFDQPPPDDDADLPNIEFDDDGDDNDMQE